MNRNKFKSLAQASYTRGDLDAKKVRQIAKLLKAKELREYIKELKKLEETKIVRLVVPNKAMISKTMLDKVKSSFLNKRLVLEEDPELILGVRIVDNDLIYDLNLKSNLQNLNNYLMDQYDQ